MSKLKYECNIVYLKVIEKAIGNEYYKVLKQIYTFPNTTIDEREGGFGVIKERFSWRRTLYQLQESKFNMEVVQRYFEILSYLPVLET